MAIAEPVLRAIGARIGPDREIVARPRQPRRARCRARWLRAQRRRRLALDAPVPPDADAALARVVGVARPARVRVRYPGVWLTDARVGDPRPLPRPPPAADLGLRASRAGCSAACRATARPRPTTSAPAATRAPGVESLVGRTPRPVAGRVVTTWPSSPRASTMPTLRRRVLRRRLAPVTSVAARPADAPGEPAGARSRRPPPRRRRRPRRLRPRPPRGPAARRRPAALARPGRARRCCSTRARGRTRRCSCTGRGRRTRTGRAARSWSTTTACRAPWACSTTSASRTSSRLRRARAIVLRARSAGPRRPARAPARRRARRGRPP